MMIMTQNNLTEDEEEEVKARLEEEHRRQFGHQKRSQKLSEESLKEWVRIMLPNVLASMGKVVILPISLINAFVEYLSSKVVDSVHG